MVILRNGFDNVAVRGNMKKISPKGVLGRFEI